MSSYLAQRIEQTPNIEVLLNMEVRRMSGDNHLGAVEIINNKTGAVRTLGRVDELMDNYARCNHVYKSQKGGCQFLISCSNTSELLEPINQSFDFIAQCIHVFVVVVLHGPVFAWWNDRRNL